MIGRWLFAALLVPSVAAAQQRWERQVQERLTRAVATIGDAVTRSLTRFSGTLNTEESASFGVSLEEQHAYAIVAVCDDDCTRLQLSLITASGSDFAKERNSESLPTLRVVAPRSERYTVRVVMEGCRWNPCWYAVAVVPLGKVRASQ